MKKITLIIITFISISIEAQEKKEILKPIWKKEGNITLLGNQSSFSNWVAGGNTAIAVNLNINYDFNYVKDTWTWDNKIILRYGLSNTKGVGERKTDDSFEINSLVGKKSVGNWSYSFFLNIRSQFTDGFDYTTEPKTITSTFFSPGYLTFGPGLLWKKSDNFNINLAPVTSKITFVSDTFSGFYGTEIGENSNYEIGFYGSLYGKFELMQNVTMENILNVFADYLENPQNIDINYQLNFVMKINDYLSTNLSFHTIVDNNTSSKVQFKEVFGLGINYKI